MTVNDLFILDNEKNLKKYWAKIYIPHPNNPDACWEWTAHKDKNGYGAIWLNQGFATKWVPLKAHRLMWVIEHDRDVPKGMQVQHNCDNPQCCNPKHLKIGDHIDNARDMKLRGRYENKARGEKHPRAILTDKKVRKICEMYYFKNCKVVDISRKFQVSRNVIQNIIVGRTWRHVSKMMVKNYQNSYQKQRERNQAIYQLYQQGLSLKQISRHYPLTVMTIYEIVRRINKGNK